MVCGDCGFSNEEDRLFCGACGEPLKGDAKLMRDMEKLNSKKAEEIKKEAQAPKPVPLQGRTPKADDDYSYKRRPAKKKDYTTDIILAFLGVVAFIVLVGCAWYLLTYYA